MLQGTVMGTKVLYSVTICCESKKNHTGTIFYKGRVGGYLQRVSIFLKILIISNSKLIYQYSTAPKGNFRNI